MSEHVSTFNVNNDVWVRLTDHGRQHLQKTRLDFQKRLYAIGINMPYELPNEVNGWSKWQLWMLMRDLGPVIDMACELPFDANISFSDPNANTGQ